MVAVTSETAQRPDVTVSSEGTELKGVRDTSESDRKDSESDGLCLFTPKLSLRWWTKPLDGPGVRRLPGKLRRLDFSNRRPGG